MPGLEKGKHKKSSSAQYDRDSEDEGRTKTKIRKMGKYLTSLPPY